MKRTQFKNVLLAGLILLLALVLLAQAPLRVRRPREWFAALNGIRFADQFPGATVSAQIDACLADAGPSTAGVCVVPPFMGAGAPTTVASNKFVWDLRGGGVGIGQWNDIHIVDGNKYPKTAVGIQSAIDAADAAGGGVVFIPPGVYNVGTTTLTLPEEVSFIGAGKKFTDFQYGGTGSFLVVAPRPIMQSNGAEIGSFQVIGPPGAPAGTVIIELQNAMGYHIHNIIMSRSETGIAFKPQQNTSWNEINLIENIHFTGSIKQIFLFDNAAFTATDYDHNVIRNIWANLDVASACLICVRGSVVSGSQNLRVESVVVFPTFTSTELVSFSGAAHTLTEATFDIRRARDAGNGDFTTAIPVSLGDTGNLLSYDGVIDGGGTNVLTGSATVRPSQSTKDTFIVHPFFGPGINNDATGFKHVRLASCTTAATQFATCTSTWTFTTAFANTSYTAFCTIDNPTNSPIVQATTNKLAGSLDIVVKTFSNDAASGTINCQAVHD